MLKKKEKTLWRKATLILSVLVISFFLLHKTAHLYIDSQEKTSIVGKRYYLVNSWAAIPQKSTLLSLPSLPTSTLNTSSDSNQQSLLTSSLKKEVPEVPEVPEAPDFEGSFKKIVFKNNKLIAQFPEQQAFVKYLVGFPGDKVLINKDGLFINQYFIKALPPAILEALAKLPTQERRLVLKADQYWVVGNSPASIDSLYFGAIEKSAYQGLVYFSW